MQNTRSQMAMMLEDQVDLEFDARGSHSSCIALWIGVSGSVREY
jgi:hypothetical protein